MKPVSLESPQQSFPHRSAKPWLANSWSRLRGEPDRLTEACPGCRGPARRLARWAQAPMSAIRPQIQPHCNLRGLAFRCCPSQLSQGPVHMSLALPAVGCLPRLRQDDRSGLVLKCRTAPIHGPAVSAHSAAASPAMHPDRCDQQTASAACLPLALISSAQLSSRLAQCCC